MDLKALSNEELNYLIKDIEREKCQRQLKLGYLVKTSQNDTLSLVYDEFAESGQGYKDCSGNGFANYDYKFYETKYEVISLIESKIKNAKMWQDRYALFEKNLVKLKLKIQDENVDDNWININGSNDWK